MNIYQQFGVPPIINASGTVTRLGGAPLPPEVLAAFQQAAQSTVSLDQLQAAASRRIAQVTGTQSGLVTSGAAGALTLGAAAILTGQNLGRMEQLPHCEGFPREFVMAREQRSGYDHAVRAAGATLVEVGFNEIVSNAGVRRTEVWEYEAAISPRTAGIVYGYSRQSRPDLGQLVEMAHQHQIPVLVDAAGEVPPRSNLKDLPATGADLVCFSGGKAIRGPQSTGILCGRRDLVAAAALQMLDMDDHPELWDPPAELIDRSSLPGLPRHGIGRALKVSKEEIIALLTALDLFVSGAYDRYLPGYQQQLESIVDALRQKHVACDIQRPATSEHWPVLEITVDPIQQGRSAMDICRTLREGSPPIYVGHGSLHDQVLTINPVCVDEPSVPLLIDGLCRELK